MILNEQQLAQRRAEFESWCRSEGLSVYDTGIAWDAYKAAWRPIPSVEDIKIAFENGCNSEMRQCLELQWDAGFEAIHRAFGGKDHG